MSTAHTGQPISRVDGRAKVTGAAKYAGEYAIPDLVYGVVVSGAIARGTITRIDTSQALGLDGVLQVFTHENIPPLPKKDSSYQDGIAPPGSPFRPLYDAEIKFSMQPVALVVANSFELARYAASLVHVDYKRKAHATDLQERRGKAFQPRPREIIPPVPKPRGRADKAFTKAAVQIDAEYLVPVEHHNPMEPYATTVLRSADGKFTVYDKTQGVQNVRDYLCRAFDLTEEELRVVSPFVGGGFGSGLRPQYQVFVALLAARALKRSVRVTLTRQQMFSLGHRPATWQRVALGAAADGTLEAVIHEVVAETSRFEDYTEPVVNWSGMLYQCANVRLDHQVTQLDVNTPLDMRAPGAAWGVYALESAMDEMAVALAMDPVELRLKNYAERDQNEDKPFSSKELRACYQQGADRFGWSRRNPQPRSTREGDKLIGWGMASGVWEAGQQSAAATAVLTADAKLRVSSATSDIGTGTYTIMTQIAAEQLGLPIENVTFELGDSTLPQAPVEGGSLTATTVGAAVRAVCNSVCLRVLELARKIRRSPFAGAGLTDVTFSAGQIYLNRDQSRAMSLTEVLRQGKVSAIEERASTKAAAKQDKFSCHTHSAVFVEVKVDEELGTLQVARVVSAIAGGRVLNPKTARSQILGGVVWGIGIALEEESLIDQAFGRFMNHNLADYHVPVNADVHDIDVIFVEERDEVLPLGAKGLGEPGLVGVPAAIANAVFHATGKRVRELPITLDKVL